MNKLILGGLLICSIVLTAFMNKKSDKQRIQPWKENPWFWQYENRPVMLLGASDDDNLFQWPANMLVPQLDSMKVIGANYVRNTMSDRQDRGFELYPFKMLDNGKYDLEQWNDDYWQRFEFFLRETRKRDIIVQIEIWDRFDYSRQHWLSHPYNPRNNVSYSESESGLAPDYPDHPGRNKQPFFFTTPEQRNNALLLNFQKRFVEKLLSISLKFDHVLYCIDNETSGEEDWAVFWAEFILDKATKKEREICVTEMWDNWDLRSDHHTRTFDHPERYVYCDISQNNQKKGQVHWDNLMWVRKYLSAHPRPLNTVKTYGSDSGPHGNTQDGIERWWRHVLGGVASARFHRPPSGLGLSKLSIAQVKAVREIESVIRLWELNPHNELLSDCLENEAYLAGKKSEAYVVYFPASGSVGLNLSDFDAEFNFRWMNIQQGSWASSQKIAGGEIVKLTPPTAEGWVAVISRLN